VNRKERRAAASRGDDTMGKSYTVLPDFPEYVRNSPGFRAGQAAAASGQGFPPRYVAAIEHAAWLVRRWVSEHPQAELRWLHWDQGNTFIAASLPQGAPYLADSPDAFALLEWLDQQGPDPRQLSINMAGWALRIAGIIPMPDGSTWKREPS
jgi:hypothetical protein